MFTHVVVGTNDIERARQFYDSVLGALGADRVADVENRKSFWGRQRPEFVVTLPLDGNAASFGNGSTIGLAAETRAQVDEFHRRALENGGTDEGAPGPRAFSPTAYGAYVRDPDGNKLCAFCYAPA